MSRFREACTILSQELVNIRSKPLVFIHGLGETIRAHCQGIAVATYHFDHFDCRGCSDPYCDCLKYSRRD